MEKKIATALNVRINVGNYQHIELTKYAEQSISYDSEDEMIKPEWGWNFAFGRFEPAVLSGLATACGDHDKKPFNDEVIGFLNQLGIVEIFAVVNQEKSEIAAMMMNIDQKNGEKFEELISKNHGSLRCDSSGLPGYCVFESE